MDDVKLDYYVTTYSGNRIYIANPDPDAVLLTDIAHQLAMTCRFGGAVKEFYSVAQHSFLAWAMARHMKVNVPTQIACLIHDGNEGPYPDIQRPIKQFLKGGWGVVEQPLEDVIYEKYIGKHLKDVDWVTLKKIDNILCVYEGRALLKQADWTWDDKWKPHFEGLPFDFEGDIKDIDPLFVAENPYDAEQGFFWALGEASNSMIDYDPEWNVIFKELTNV